MFEKHNGDEQVKQYIITGCIPPLVMCDLWSLPMKAVRDMGYRKATLGHNLLTKIFSNLDHVLMESARSPLIWFAWRPEHPHSGRFSPQRSIWWYLVQTNRPFKT